MHALMRPSFHGHCGLFVKVTKASNARIACLLVCLHRAASDVRFNVTPALSSEGHHLHVATVNQHHADISNEAYATMEQAMKQWSSAASRKQVVDKTFLAKHVPNPQDGVSGIPFPASLIEKRRRGDWNDYNDGGGTHEEYMEQWLDKEVLEEYGKLFEKGSEVMRTLWLKDWDQSVVFWLRGQGPCEMFGIKGDIFTNQKGRDACLIDREMENYLPTGKQANDPKIGLQLGWENGKGTITLTPQNGEPLKIGGNHPTEVYKIDEHNWEVYLAHDLKAAPRIIEYFPQGARYFDPQAGYRVTLKTNDKTGERFLSYVTVWLWSKVRPTSQLGSSKNWNASVCYWTDLRNFVGPEFFR